MASLLERYPLDAAWTHPALFSESVSVGETRIELCGLSARRGRELATGSAAGLDASPLERAYFELIERTSILEVVMGPVGTLCVLDRDQQPIGALSSARLFPTARDGRCVYARSNGVAVGLDWGSACDAARWELIERDRILRSFYGAAPPIRVDHPALADLAGLEHEYELEAYLFPDFARPNSAFVAAVFAFPRREERPMVFGFGAHAQRGRALEKAARECLQRLGFLWGETLPCEEPPFEANAEYHQEFYLQPRMQQRLRAWLSGKHVRMRCGIRQHERVYRQRAYVDLTPKALRNQLSIVKALPVFEIELTFGHGHPRLVPPLPEELLVHPVA